MIIAALLVIGVGAVSLIGPPSAPTQPSVVADAPAAGPERTPPASPSELAVVAPLAPGADLGGWTVDGIEGVHDGAIAVVLHRDEQRFSLRVALDSPGGPLAPAHVGRYAIYYSGGIDGAEAQTLAAALQAVIATHPDVEPPPGLGVIVVEPPGDGA
jgi:hypothetical protein